MEPSFTLPKGHIFVSIIYKPYLLLLFIIILSVDKVTEYCKENDDIFCHCKEIKPRGKTENTLKSNLISLWWKFIEPIPN